jgi:hypothetical protein
MAVLSVRLSDIGALPLALGSFIRDGSREYLLECMLLSLLFILGYARAGLAFLSGL